MCLHLPADTARGAVFLVCNGSPQVYPPQVTPSPYHKGMSYQQLILLAPQARDWRLALNLDALPELRHRQIVRLIGGVNWAQRGQLLCRAARPSSWPG